MTTSSTHKRKSAYDPMRQWGLKPEENTSTGSATYVLSGHIVTGSSSDPRAMYVAESVGREGQAKAKRKLAGKEADRALKDLLERDKEGMRAVMKAREAHTGKGKGVKLDKDRAKRGSKAMVGKKRKKERLNSDEGDSDDEDEDDRTRKTTYSAGVIKSLGFDPTMKPGQRRMENKGVQNKVCVCFNKRLIGFGNSFLFFLCAKLFLSFSWMSLKQFVLQGRKSIWDLNLDLESVLASSPRRKRNNGIRREALPSQMLL